MSQIHTEASDVIDARPEQIYAVLSDYRVGHPAILPRPYFEELTVEQGGQGAGTILRVRMKVYGRKFAFRQIVSEPQPGRVLMEANDDDSATTTFTLEPLGDQTRVTIVTVMQASPGLLGFMEKLTTPSVMGRIYRQELRNLAEYLRSRQPVN